MEQTEIGENKMNKAEQLKQLISTAKHGKMTREDEALLLVIINRIGIHVMLKKGVPKDQWEDHIQTLFYNFYYKLDTFNENKCRNPANWLACLLLNAIRKERGYHNRFIPTENECIYKCLENYSIDFEKNS